MSVEGEALEMDYAAYAALACGGPWLRMMRPSRDLASRVPSAWRVMVQPHRWMQPALPPGRPGRGTPGDPGDLHQP
jgi:hypothetical protein